MAKKKLILKENHTLDDLTQVNKTVLPLAKQLLGLNGMMEIELLANWRDIVGETLAQYSLPQKIRFNKNERSNGLIELVVLSGAFALEIKQREKQILEKINTYFGYSAVSKLKIIQNSSPENFLLKKKPIDNVKNFLVSETEQTYITELVKDIHSDKLRETLNNLGKAVLGKKS